MSKWLTGKEENTEEFMLLEGISRGIIPSVVIADDGIIEGTLQAEYEFPKGTYYVFSRSDLKHQWGAFFVVCPNGEILPTGEPLNDLPDEGALLELIGEAQLLNTWCGEQTTEE